MLRRVTRASFETHCTCKLLWLQHACSPSAVDSNALLAVAVNVFLRSKLDGREIILSCAERGAGGESLLDVSKYF